MCSIVIAITTLVPASLLIPITSYAQVTGSSTTITRATNFSDAGKINQEIQASELREIFAQANQDKIIMGIFPVRPTPDAPHELQFYFPGVSGTRPTNAEEVPLLYYIEIAQPLGDKFAGITFYYSAENKQIEYFVLESNGKQMSDSATCKCPPECCAVSVIAEGVAESCNTEASTCLSVSSELIYMPYDHTTTIKKKKIKNKKTTYVKPTPVPGASTGGKKPAVRN